MPAVYSGQNLRGRSFNDKNLRGADFSKANIRGADFTNADLVGAKFNEAKINGANFYESNLSGAILDKAVCGVKTWWTIIIMIMSLFIISLSGFSASIIISCNFYFFSEIRGINRIISTILISVVYITIFHAYFLKTFFNIDQSVLLNIGICIILTVGFLIPFIQVMDDKNDNKQIFSTILIFSIAVVILNLYLLQVVSDDLVMFRRAVGAFFGSILGIIISHLAITKKDKKYVWIWNLFLYIISVKGTKFYLSNLDDASFVNTNIKGSSFVACTVIRTNWDGVKKIDCSRIQVDYLENSKIRDLVVIKRVMKEINYEDMCLNGLNLDNAELDNILFSKADLSNSTLKNAKLKKSYLYQTRLDNVDLSASDITGARIEKKSIPSTAKLDGLICKYFYPQSNSEQRHPITGELTSEEAIKVLQKPSKISIVFEQDGIDWQAFLQAFENSLKEFNISPENSEKLIQAFERKLDDNFVIRLNVPDNVDEVDFQQKLRQAYDKAIEDLKRQYRNSLKTTDIDFQDNTSLLKITKQLAQPGNIIIHNHNIVKTQNNSTSQPTEIKNIDAKTILILASNPKTTTTLRLDEEVREIDAGLQRARKREQFDLKQRWAVRVQDLYQALLDFKPQFVHFSGHGSGDDGLVLEDETGNVRLVETVALTELFKLFASDIQCVVLNACYSEVQASAIAKHIPYLIGMKLAIGDKAAIKFATGFYNALGAGESVEFAYKLGCNVIQLEGIPENLTPVLKKKQSSF